ncbi:hypothetical protein [Cytobacillus firmus]|nr:hypothetical protein [Cytobacillus firmus]MCS0653165.1 hypothetical protein [Cytobacillus firmus]
MNNMFAAGADILRIWKLMNVTMTAALAAVWILSEQLNLTYGRVEK